MTIIIMDKSFNYFNFVQGFNSSWKTISETLMNFSDFEHSVVPFIDFFPGSQLNLLNSTFVASWKIRRSAIVIFSPQMYGPPFDK